MTILAVYEDDLTYHVAERLFKRVAVAAESDYELHLTLRSFDLLADPELGTQAANFARVADLVLVSAYRHGRWPRAVRQWLELWAGADPAQHGGLAALLVRHGHHDAVREAGPAQHGGLAALLVRSPAGAHAADERCASLEHLARVSGRDFFFAKDIILGTREVQSSL